MTFKKRHVLGLVVGVWLSGLAASGQSLPNLYPFPNASGVLETYNAGNGPIDLTGPFFQSLGTNGRSCGSCHKPAQGWGISAAEVKTRFYLTQGLDPIFRTNDGSNCDHNIDTSTLGGRQKAYSLLTNKGLIRSALQEQATAELSEVSVANPYGGGDLTTLSVYRRPLPSTNLRFLSTLMWDGRESSAQTGTQKITFATNPGDLLANLAQVLHVVQVERGVRDLVALGDDSDFDALLRSALVLGDDQVLGHVDESTGQVAGVGGLERRIGQTLSRTVGGDEVFENRQAFLEVGLDGVLDGLLARELLPVTPPDARPELDREHPRAGEFRTLGQPVDVLVLEWVVAQQRLVAEPDRAHCVGVRVGVEALDVAPLGTACDERLRPRITGGFALRAGGARCERRHEGDSGDYCDET